MEIYEITTKERGDSIREGMEDIIKAALLESPWSDGEFDDKQIELLIQLFLGHPNPKERIAIVAMDGPLLIGFIAAVVQGSVVKHANELVWYVLPPHRKSGAGIELIKRYEQWAKSLGLKKAVMSHYKNALGDHLSELYNKIGYKQTEIMYVKDLE